MLALLWSSGSNVGQSSQQPPADDACFRSNNGAYRERLHMMALICVTDISLSQSEGSLQPPGTQAGAGPHRDSSQVQVRCISHQECCALQAGSHSSRPVTFHCPVLTLPDCSSGKVPESTTPKFGAKFLAVMLSRACIGHTVVRCRFTCCQGHQASKYVCKNH